jgi:hypothetical protein
MGYTLKNGYRGLSVKWASSTWETEIISGAVKQMRKEGGEDESEIHTAVMRNPYSSWKQATITDCFSK